MNKLIQKTPAWQIVLQIQRQGEMTIRELVDALGVTTTAVRQQVDRLVGQGILQASKRSGKRGRPSDVFSVTERGHALFTHRCDEILGMVLTELVKDRGEEEAKELLRRAGNSLADRYAERIRFIKAQAGNGKPDGWKDRIKTFAEYLDENGIPTEFQDEGDSVLFRQFCCPYYTVARQEPSICAMDVQMLAELAGRPVTHAGCVLDGGVACEFQISGNSDRPRSKGATAEPMVSVEDKR